MLSDSLHCPSHERLVEMAAGLSVDIRALKENVENISRQIEDNKTELGARMDKLDLAMIGELNIPGYGERLRNAEKIGRRIMWCVGILAASALAQLAKIITDYINML